MIGLAIGAFAQNGAFPFDNYAADGFQPSLVLDFENGLYAVNGVASSFGAAVTFSRASTASYIDSSGGSATAAVDEPRFDYRDGARALLIEDVDSVSIPAANLPYSSTAMAIAMRGTMDFADSGTFEEVSFYLWKADANNEIQVRLRTDVGTGTGQPQVVQRAAGVADRVPGVNGPVTYTPGTGVAFSIASRHQDTAVNIAVDGTAFTEDATPTALPDLSATSLVFASPGTLRVSRFLMWGSEIGDTGIAAASA